ncbi:hypothetical protein LCL61_23920 [Amycolatopsis coloradensis]|uniref:Uncharacterized protein n=1 Tax=Amycolatopsis coloradensis TaxID=76021 RepID=A0ACD5BGN8_9PSEU
MSLSPCLRCTLGKRERSLLGDRAELAALHHAITLVGRPDTAMAWLAPPNVSALLAALGRDDRPLTHEVLDELPASKTLAHLRSVPAATGTLLPAGRAPCRPGALDRRPGGALTDWTDRGHGGGPPPPEALTGKRQFWRAEVTTAPHSVTL